MTRSVKILVVLTLLIVAFSCSKDDDAIQPIITTGDFSTTINELPENGAVIGTVTGTVNIGDIAFELSSQSPNGAMAINATSGELTVADETLLSFSVTPTITGVVLVSSGDVSETVNITVNLSQAVITTSNFSVTIDEEPAQGAILGTLEGISNIGDVTFSVSTQTPAGAMVIDATTGELAVADASLFVYEINPTITAEVLVSSGSANEMATVTIYLNDVYNLASDREALINIYNANPNNTLTWDITSTDVSNWEGVELIDQRITFLRIGGKSLSTVPSDALYSLTALKNFFANNNSLTSIDITKNIQLSRVELFSNAITAIDVSNNPLLEILNIESNNLTTLDLQNLTVLRSFKAHSNKFSGSINIANGNNNNMVRMHLHNNPDITCIQVDSDFNGGGSDWAKDATAEYSSNCN